MRQAVWFVMQSVQFMYKIKQYVHHEQENQERNKSLISELKGKTKEGLVNLLECPNYMSVWCLYNTFNNVLIFVI